MNTIDYGIILSFVLGGVALMIQRCPKLSDIIGYTCIMIGVILFIIQGEIIPHIKTEWSLLDYYTIIISLFMMILCFSALFGTRNLIQGHFQGYNSGPLSGVIFSPPI